MIKRMPFVVWQLLKAKMGWSPAIIFDGPRYNKLIHKCPGSSLPECNPEPEVEFSFQGPIDGILGTFDPETKKITIDAIEIFTVCLMKEKSDDRNDIADRYDELVTQVLAHEGGHWHLDKKLGKLAMAERYLIYGVIYSAAILLVALIVISISALIAGMLDWLVYFLPLPIAALIGFIIVYLVINIFAKFAVSILDIGHSSALVLTHRFCYHERFANEFEKCVDLNPEWEKVVTVKLE